MPSRPNEPLPPDLPPAAGRPRVLIRVLLYLFLALVGLVMFGPIFSGTIEIGLALLLGWVRFLARTLPQVGWNWALISLALIGLTLLLAGTHHSLSWLARAIPIGDPASSRRWQWRWTWCGFTLIGVAFTAGMSVGGIVHQVGWMATTPEPVMQRRGIDYDYMALRDLDLAVRQSHLDEVATVSEMRADAIRGEYEFHLFSGQRRNVLDSFHVLLIMGQKGKIEGHIVFPRDSQTRKRIGGRYDFEDQMDAVPAEKIDGLIRRHKDRLLAL